MLSLFVPTAFAQDIWQSTKTLRESMFRSNLKDVTPSWPDGTSLLNIIGNLINFALSLIGLIATGYLIYAGFKFIISGGQDEIRKRIVQTIFGIGVIMVAQFVVSFATGADIFLTGKLPNIGGESGIHGQEVTLPEIPTN